MSRLALVIVFGISAINLLAQSDQDIARILEQNKKALGLSSQDLSEYTITDVYTTEHLGITHVYLQQRYHDIPVHNGILNLNLLGDRLMSYGNRWIPRLDAAAPTPLPAVTAQTAVVSAAAHLGARIAPPAEISRSRNTLGRVTKVHFEGGSISRSDMVSELVWIQDTQKRVALCWAVEVDEVGAENVWQIFIDAHSGKFVRQHNLVRHCAFNDPREADDNQGYSPAHSTSSGTMLSFVPDSSYTVFAMPVESPNHGTRSVVVTPWHDAGAGNPATTLGWHNNGTTNYTMTRGNNVHAYEDIDHNNAPGFSPDTATLQFDYPFDPQLDPAENMEAAITNLFYWNNIMHDVMYQYGFDEVSGNFQVDNLGRGGAGGDDVRAEALDGGGTNNANFYTPSDGNRPRMQMYLWSPVSDESPLTINSPVSVAGSMYAVESDFSNANKLVDIGLTTGDLVLVNDADTTTHEACGTISNADSLSGRIAVIDRGNCDFVVKVKAVQDHGAIAAIVINNVSGSPVVMGGTDNSIVIPAVMVSLDDGNLLKAVMDTSNINASMDSVPTIIPDGDYDSGIIAHEYGHGISIRLTGGPSNVSCLNNDEQMGEGWSDYFGLMLTTDWNTALTTDSRGIGTYVLGEATDGTGIRSYPYTTDTMLNPFTYADIADAPVISGNVSPHFVGSVWCTMLWDMTWSIIDLVAADPDLYHGTGGNNIALQLVLDALKLQPCSPGFVDGRDAILLADQLRYGGQYSCAIWNAFAGRGLGVNADQGSTNDHQDGVESYSVPTGVRIESFADLSEATEGQEVTFTVRTICECEGKSNLQINEVLSEDLIYIPDSGGTLSGDTVMFSADTLSATDSLVFSYRAMIVPCSATVTTALSEDDAEGPDQYESIKLAGTGNKNWVKSTAQSVSAPNSWYAKDYTNGADIALTLIDPLVPDGPVEITFYHRYETEATYDGGVVEYSLDGGMTWLDAGNVFTENGYPSSINSSTNSTIAGRAAFTGDSDAQFDTTGFVRSTIRLSSASGQSFLLRFRFATDGFVGGPGINGWYVDNILINQLSGVTNQTRVAADSILTDSLYYTLLTTVFEGDTLYVDQSAAGNQSGASWANAMHELPYAVAIAGCRDADSIFVAEGTYLPNRNGDRQLSFSIPDSTSLFGGFPAGGSAFALRDPLSYPTLLSGDIGAANDNSDNLFHVLKIDSAQQEVLVDGFTLIYGNADGAADDASGSALLCEGSLTLQNVILNQNHGLSDGQLILIRGAGAHLHLQDCTIHMPPDDIIQLLNTGSAQLSIGGNTVFIPE